MDKGPNRNKINPFLILKCSWHNCEELVYYIITINLNKSKRTHEKLGGHHPHILHNYSGFVYFFDS